MGRGVWKRLEKHIANKLSKKYGKTLVFIGPVLKQPLRKLNGKVAIPDAFYTVVMVKSKSGKAYAIGFIIPQNPKSKSIWRYCVPIDEIEMLTGIDFFPKLPERTIYIKRRRAYRPTHTETNSGTPIRRIRCYHTF